MKMQSLFGVVMLGFAFALATPAYAEFLDKTAAETLLKGNTIEGHDFKYGREVTIHFATTGMYKRVDDLKNKESGSWKIESDGRLCMQHSQHAWNCRNIKPAKKEGKYLLIRDGKKSVRINKVLPGNPHDL